MTSFLTRFKNGFTFIKEQDGVIDLGLSENELEILSSRHGPKRGEVDQENLGKYVTISSTTIYVYNTRKWTVTASKQHVHNVTTTVSS